MHFGGQPRAVKAIEYEGVPGQAAIRIFLEGDADSAKFNYELYMVGTAAEGYRVGGFYRLTKPSPVWAARTRL
jgi:hypothetical protein